MSPEQMEAVYNAGLIDGYRGAVHVIEKLGEELAKKLLLEMATEHEAANEAIGQVKQ